MSGDEQILLQEVSRLLITLSLRQNKEKKINTDVATQVFTQIVTNLTQQYSDFVYNFLGQYLTSLQTAIKNGLDVALLCTSLCDYLQNEALPKVLTRDEKYCKVNEMLLKILYSAMKSSAPADFQSLAKLSDTLILLKQKFTSNPSILSQIIKLLSLIVLSQHRLLMSTPAIVADQPSIIESFTHLFSLMSQLIQGYCSMHHKEQVRIAVSKALSRLFPLIQNINQKMLPNLSEDQEMEVFKAQVGLVYALIILLNDENPDIRTYLGEKEAGIKLVQREQQTESEAKQSYRDSVCFNDQYLIEKIFKDYTELILQQPNEDKKLYFKSHFLLQKFLSENPYRDHLAKNYEDKIFFFEPVNKFYDLLWVKRLAFDSALSMITQSVTSAELTAQEENSHTEDSLDGSGHPIIMTKTKLEESKEAGLEQGLQKYFTKEVMKHSSQEYEEIQSKVMLLRVLKDQQVPEARQEYDMAIKKLLSS